ncbi:MAG: hypothetical protein M5T61_06760 [Acidimicrobiia bacterium]|nr:hypothetical protein [Acidimicrobiia bacterium]
MEIWESVGIAGPEVHVSPAGEGVTGLETWVWSGGATSAVVDATIGAWTVTGSASLVAWSVDPGDGTGAHATDHPGDAEDHALDHDYEIKGTYPLSVTAVWTADVTLSGPGLPPVPVSIGTALLTSTRQYRVVEVVPVLLP